MNDSRTLIFVFAHVDVRRRTDHVGGKIVNHGCSCNGDEVFQKYECEFEDQMARQEK